MMSGSILYTLKTNYSTLSTPLEQVRYWTLISAFTPFIIVILWSAGSFFMNYQVNTAGLMPIATSFFLYTVIKSKHTASENILKDPRRLLFSSREATLNNCVQHNTIQSVLHNRNWKDSLACYEAALLRYHVEHHCASRATQGLQPSKTALAKQLGLSRQTLDRRLREHDLSSIFRPTIEQVFERKTIHKPTLLEHFDNKK